MVCGNTASRLGYLPFFCRNNPVQDPVRLKNSKNLFYLVTTIIGLCEEWSWWLKSILQIGQTLQKFFNMTSYCILIIDL